MATIVAASFGFAGLTQAAPLAAVAAAFPAVQMTQEPSAAEAVPKKASYHKKPSHCHKYHHHHHHVYHRHHGKHH